MTVIWLLLTTKQTGIGNQMLGNSCLYFTALHYVYEVLLIVTPFTLIFCVAIKHILGWCERRQMHIFHVTNFAKKILKVILFGESCKLRDVVETHVDDTSSARLFKF